MKLILGILRNPNLYINGSCISNWTTPATSTPYDNEITGITKSDDEKIVKTIKLKFKKTGVIPDKIKRSYELNMPAHIAVKEINNKYLFNSIYTWKARWGWNPCPEINLRTEIENFHKIFWSMQLVELNKSTYQYGFIDIKSEEKGKIFCFKILTATKIKIYLR